jgi:hypothetical protein
VPGVERFASARPQEETVKITRCLAAAALALLPFLLAPVAADDRCPATLAGTWTEKVDFNYIVDPSKPQETVKFYLAHLSTFTADGRVIANFPTGEGHPNVGDTRVTCQGEWRPKGKTRPHHLEVFLKCMYNQAWDGVYAEIRGTLQLDAGGKKYKWYFSYIDYNADGTVAYDEGRGVAYGTRLEF